jgi:hypothetical protein
MWRIQRIVFGTLVLAAVAGTTQAGTVTGGTAVTIGGLDNLAATVNTQAKAGAGKALAIVLGVAGLAILAAGRPGLGLGGLGAGVGMAFVPNIISTAFDATAAASFTPIVSALGSPWSGWWPLFLATLYPVLLVLRAVQDPIILSCLALACALRLWWTARSQALAVR